jgi:hypothetical protein
VAQLRGPETDRAKHADDEHELCCEIHRRRWHTGGGALLGERSRVARIAAGRLMLPLALGYTLIEEGSTTQTLFNPNVAGQRLFTSPPSGSR